MHSAPSEPQINNYSFRIRVDRSPRETIECAEPELPLVVHANSIRVCLRNKTSDQPIKGAQHLELVGTGYTTEVNAKEAGNAFENVFMVTLARLRIGADFGYRAVKNIVTSEGIKLLEQQHKLRILNDVHGLMVYKAEPEPRFALSKVDIQCGASKEAFLHAFKAAAFAQPHVSDREHLAFSLFNSSFFQPTADSRFLLLVMSIEALIELAPRSTESQNHVKSLIAITKAASIPLEERESMLGAIRWLTKESINQAGRRLVTARLGMRLYDGRTAADFFSHVYHMRSNLVHGNLPYPTIEMVGTAAGTLEFFVSELLTAPILGFPKQGT